MFKKIDLYLAKKYGYIKSVGKGHNTSLTVIDIKDKKHYIDLYTPKIHDWYDYYSEGLMCRITNSVDMCNKIINKRTPLHTQEGISLERCNIVSYETKQEGEARLEAKPRRKKSLQNWLWKQWGIFWGMIWLTISYWLYTQEIETKSLLGFIFLIAPFFCSIMWFISGCFFGMFLDNSLKNAEKNTLDNHFNECVVEENTNDNC